MNSARSWIVWGAAVFAYLIAVTQRSTIGVAGVEAAQRFHVSAAELSTLTVLQLAVYAALQVPVGVLLDRAGPKRLIMTGAALMAVGQLVVAFAPNLGVAVLGRMLVGAGDAGTFISVMRLLPAWFGGRLLPQVSQWTGNVGALGQLSSAIPFSALLHAAGWTPAFSILAAVSLAGLLAVLFLVANGETASAPPAVRAERGETVARLKNALSRPGTQLGFWSHFVTQSSGTVFSLLWGLPFVVAGAGYSTTVGSGLLALLVVAGLVSGPVLGILTARFPTRRSNLVLAIVTAMALAWALVLAWPGQPPLWALAILVVVVGVGGPGSIIGFDFARTFNPLRNLGSANGIVNVGGFVASFTMMFLIGAILDVLDRIRVAQGLPSDVYALDSFRLAFLVQYLVVGMGVLFLIRARRRTRMRMHEEEGIEVAPLWVAIGRAWRRRRRRGPAGG
ncbi:MFS transporter [Herbiconiux sp. SYSU D00978]|uniref:MFS transporter n=1 Tax=Herbiconiux sp. SYSU D00978 TaxID=2812562 RepID=UPI001A97141F|nr:MFS transporter [Herbiconiux sp. SYSU D00978]